MIITIVITFVSNCRLKGNTSALHQHRFAQSSFSFVEKWSRMKLNVTTFNLLHFQNYKKYFETYININQSTTPR